MSDCDSKSAAKIRKPNENGNNLNNEELKKIDQEIEELCEQEEELERAIVDHIQLLQHRRELKLAQNSDDMDFF